jgi:hypothetical protein
MTDLVTWLTQQLDHDERVAQTVLDRYVDVRDGSRYWPLPSVEARFHDADPEIAAGLELIKANGPARVLRQVAAHRRILAACIETRGRRDHWAEVGVERFLDRGHIELEVFGYALRALASIYAAREGYDAAWAVQ